MENGTSYIIRNYMEHIPPFWVQFEKDAMAVMKFYGEMSFGEQIEEHEENGEIIGFLTPEEAMLLLYADVDLRTPGVYGHDLLAITFYTDWVADEE